MADSGPSWRKISGDQSSKLGERAPSESGDQSTQPGERAPSEIEDQSSKPGEKAPSETEDQSSKPGERAPPESGDQSSKPGEKAPPENEDQSSNPGERAPSESGDQSTQPGERAPSETPSESTQPGERAPSETPSESTQPGERAPSETPSESTQPGERAPPESGDQSTQPGERAPSETPSESTQPGERAPSETPSESTQLMEVSESGSERTQPMDCLAAGSGAQLVDLLQSCPEQTLLLGSEFSGLGPDLSNTTIIYVQADGSLVEGSGLTAEEQQALLEQLTQQQVVQVSDSEAAQLLHQSQLLRTTTTHNTALDPSQLQQVINQVTKSQQQVQVPQQNLKQVQVPQQNLKQVQVPQQNLKQVQVPQQNLKQVQVPQQNLKQVQVPQQNLKNASQQLKTAAQQVAMQTGGSVQVIQKKPEPVRIQIQVPSKQEVKSGLAPQQGIVAVNHPHVKLSANGSAQILHLQPVIGQQGQQFFLQQGDAPIQLLLHSPAPVPGSLLPLVHKLTGQTSSSSQKPPVRVPPPAVIRTEAKTASIPLIKTSKSPSTPVQAPVKLVQGPVKLVQGPVKPVQGPVKPVQGPVKPVQSPVKPVQSPGKPVQSLVKPVQSPRPPVRDKEQKKRKRESKAAKVQTRSGRVSRPPKYKAKDYKFIKTEDLADSHQSDSDDYSDLSEEEEEEGGPGLTPPLTCSHKSRPHSCQTCDKAYIGAGGLNRHYRLNPTHGEPDPPGDTPRPLSDDSQSEETTAGRGEEEEEKEEEEKPVAMTTSRVEGGPAAGLRGLPPRRGPGRPRGRGRGRGRGRVLGPPPKVVGGLVSRRGRRGRPPKLAVTMATAEQLAERRRERLQEVVQQCGDQELVEALLPRLSERISLWELLLAKVDGGAATRFPDMYREFESLQAQVRQAAQDYIISPQAGGAPLEVRNIEVARSLGILDEVNRMKVLPGSSPSLTNKSARYLENSKMLPPSKRFKMENRVQQNGVTGPVFGPSGSSPLKSDSASSSCPPAEARTLIKEEVMGPGSEPRPESALPEEQIYLQTGGLTVQPGDRMVILNGPDGTTMQIQTPEGVPLEGVPLEGVPLEALLGIEAPQ